MEKIRVWFYLAGRDPEWKAWIIGHGISCYTRFLAFLRGDFKAWRYYWFTHVELEFVRDKMIFSSTTRGGTNGVQLRPSEDVLKHPERWMYIEIEVPCKMYGWGIEDAEAIAGKFKYGFRDLLRFFFPFLPNAKGYICSEIVSESLHLMTVVTEDEYCSFNGIISPLRLASILSKRYGEPRKVNQ